MFALYRRMWCLIFRLSIALNDFLHLHEIGKLLLFHYSLSMCVCMCVVCLLARYRTNCLIDFDAGFAYQGCCMSVVRSGSKIVILGQTTR